GTRPGQRRGEHRRRHSGVAAVTEAMAMGDWRRDNARWLATSLDLLRLRLQRHARWLHHDAPNPRVADWLVVGEVSARRRRFDSADAASRSLGEAMNALERRLSAHEEHMRGTTRPPALRSLAERVGL